MHVHALVAALESIAPLNLAESWDKVGLLVGDLAQEFSGPILLAIDLSEDVLDEAIDLGAGAIIAYHPPIWEPLKRLTASSATERIILRAARAGIIIYSPHTALDACTGGINDWLCEGFAPVAKSSKSAPVAGDCRALTPHAELASTQELKIVTFVPEADANRIRQGLATAGAGIIGGYQVCSFAAPGTGTFLATEGTNPRIGQRNHLEHVPEVRLEMVVSAAGLALALETLRQFHPYEEPAIDVYTLHAKPQRSVGPGRRLVLDRPATINTLAERIRSFLGVEHVLVATPRDWSASKQIERIGICAGAGASLVPLAHHEGCEIFFTGELKHHEVMDCLRRGLGVILAGHTNTERGYLPRLAQKLKSALPGCKTLVSRTDKDPLRVV
ncbi:MAG: Nif3-like dinuclear metal center hexameric protein [Planctomycetes bacterium]|nr:Nif3-like dinuclear metal center hexameric protein [Planctomycetota bacterium]